MNLKKGVIYVFIANVINLIISLFSGFVLPKFLSIESYADIKLFQLYITYIGILHLGFADGIYLKYGGKTKEDISKTEILAEFKTFKVFQIIVSIIAIVISLVLKNYILLCCSIVILPINVGSYLRNLYESIGEFKKYSRINNISTILIFIINVILLLIVKTDEAAIYIVLYIISYFIYLLILEIENTKIFGKEKTKINKKYFVKDIKEGFFLMTGSFCNVIFTSIDRLFVQYLFGNIKFAYYSFAVSIENLMGVFITPITTVMYNYLCINRERDKILKLKRIILGFGTIIIAVIFPAKFVINIWLNKYNESLAVLFILFAAQFINIIIRAIHVNLYKANKKQNRFFIIMIIIVVVSAIFNVIFYFTCNKFEMIAIATLVTNIIWYIIGEIDLKEYRSSIKDYIYMALIILLFVLVGYISNAVLGCIIYIICATVLIRIFIPDAIEFAIVEIKRYISKK